MSTLQNQRQAKSQALPFLFEQPKRVAVFCRNATAEDAYMDALVNAGNVQ